MKNRIVGFDLARAYAIFGMFIVNFNTVFGSHTNHSGLSGFLNSFNGNSSTLFVMLAGMGVALMTNQPQYSLAERNNTRSIILKRARFLFGIGALFCLWWPADILHFYGVYLSIAALFLFLPKKYVLFAALAAILIFHILLGIIPYETGWNLETFVYSDFWTFPGFVRNTFYNGWNSVFPWIAYFFLGMYLGKLNWKDRKTPLKVMLIGLSVYIATCTLQYYAAEITSDENLLFYLTADYLPPFLPFMLGTASYGLILIGVFIFIGNRFGETQLVKALAATGQMTLTHYIAHLTLGFFCLSFVTGKQIRFEMLDETPITPASILIFAIVYFLFSCAFSFLWNRKYKTGPLETVMRKISG